jgi:hypothetical protein
VKKHKIIGYDKTGEWALINPSDYEEWLSECVKPINKSGKIQSSNPKYLQKRNQFIRVFIQNIIAYGVFITFIPDYVIKDSENTVIIENIMNFTSNLILISVVISLLGLVFYSLAHKSTTK